MILPDFLVLNETGLYCKAGDFYLDPRRAVRQAVISHAHADHAAPGSLKVYSTFPTMEFMKLRYKKQACRDQAIFKYGEPFKIGEVDLCFYPAGHMLGSAQVWMAYKGASYLYTGDFKLQADETCEAYEFAKADVLITETTFAHPDIAHPDAGQAISYLNTLSENILIGAYALGKAQRLACLLGLHCPEKEVSVHYSIAPYNYIYEREGKTLGKWKLYHKREFRYGKDQVYIVPPLTYRSHAGAFPGCARLFASGWEGLQSGNVHKLFISDHADWNELLHLIETMKPREVWTLHGDGTRLQKELENKLIVRILNEGTGR